MAEYCSFGEIMLRLKSPGHERLFQSPSLEATFGGGEGSCQKDGRPESVLLAGLDEQAQESFRLLPFVARSHSHGGDALCSISAVASERRGSAV